MNKRTETPRTYKFPQSSKVQAQAFAEAVGGRVENSNGNWMACFEATRSELKSVLRVGRAAALDAAPSPKAKINHRMFTDSFAEGWLK
jgi:predicted kinase